MAKFVEYTIRGTRWEYSAGLLKVHHVATRHDGVFIDSVGDHLVAYGSDLKPRFDNRRWTDKSLKHMMEVFDNRIPPEERIFLCGGCKATFSRPRSGFVNFYCSPYSGLIPVCGTGCESKAVNFRQGSTSVG